MGAHSAPKTLAAAGVVFAGVFMLGPLGFASGTVAHADDGYVLGIGGNGERTAHLQGRSTGMDAMLAEDAKRGNQVQNLDYHSSVWPDGSRTHDESIADGIRNGNRALDEQEARNPNAPVTVKGVSLGAPVALALAGRADKVIVYGNPGSSKGIYRALPGIYPGTSSPGAQPLPPNAVSVCHQYDLICDTRAPWEDPAYFVQSVAGYLQAGYHGYAPNEGIDLPPGEHVTPMAPPIKEIPASTPTGLGALPPLPLPKWEPGPLPTPFPGPYVETKASEVIPDVIETFLPPQVLDTVIPPLPTLPDLGIWFP